MQNKYLRFIRLNVLLIVLLTTHWHTHAQNVKGAVNSTFISDLEFCNGVTCPTPGQNIVCNSGIRSLNADMVTIESPGSPGSYPGYFGITGTTWGNLWGVAFSGVSNADITNASGFTIGSSTSTGRESLPLPLWGSLYVGHVANDPDIAVGTCYSTNSSDYEHFALAVYEDNGEIYLEHYEINISPTAITTQPPAPFICPFPPPTLCAIPAGNNRIWLTSASGASGTASKPHIEIWHEYVNPTASGIILATKYAVVWQQEDPTNPGQMQVWGIDGEIDQPGYILPTPNQSFAIADGKQPDVVAVNYFDMAGGAASNKGVAYVTYLSDNRPFTSGRDVLLSDWDYNTQTVNGTITLNTAPTANDDEFETPRISGPMYYDISAPSPDDPLCVVVVNDNDANSTNLINKVTAYKVYHSSITSPGPIIEKLDISDYNNFDGFSSNSQTAIMPAVTGVGKEVAALAGVTAYDDYPVVFYSDFKYGLGQDGDFYAFGLKMDKNTADPELWSSSGYWEVNYNTLDNGANFDIVSDKPMIAVATANNSGYDLLTTFYEGSNLDKVTVAFTGTAAKYDFKPGRPAGVQQLNQAGIAVYPNPVKDRLNITNADGAAYTVTDVTGRSISTGILSGSMAGVDASSLVPGMYILHISKDGHTEQVKFVKQ
jgi:hypothetical protein